MENNGFYSAFFSELKKKWYIVVLLMFIVGGGLMFEKRSVASRPVSVSASAYAVQLVKVVSDGGQDLNLPREIPQGGLFLNSSITKYSYMKESQKNFDYSKFNANFPLLTEENKYDWIHKRLWSDAYYPNLFAVTFWVKDEDAKDMEYVNENAEKFLSEYIAFCDKKLRDAKQGHLEVVDKTFLPSEGKVHSPRYNMAKYGAVGGALGFCVGILIIAASCMRKLKND